MSHCCAHRVRRARRAREGAERGAGVPASDGDGGSGGVKPPGLSNESKLIARDDRKNPLISTFDWTSDAVQRVFRVPAGFMRNKTQERVEELARERAEASRAAGSGEGALTIDLALVEDGIEFGKKMMAEMISTYSPPSASPTAGDATARVAATPREFTSPPDAGSYLNEVRRID